MMFTCSTESSRRGLCSRAVRARNTTWASTAMPTENSSPDWIAGEFSIWKALSTTQGVMR